MLKKVLVAVTLNLDIDPAMLGEKETSKDAVQKAVDAFQHRLNKTFQNEDIGAARVQTVHAKLESVTDHATGEVEDIS